MLGIVKKFVKLLLLLCVIAIILSLIFGNQQSVDFSIPPTPYTVSIPLYLLLALFFVSGILLALLHASFYYTRAGYRYKKQLKQLHKKNDAMRSELESLRVEDTARTKLALQPSLLHDTSS